MKTSLFGLSLIVCSLSLYAPRDGHATFKDVEASLLDHLSHIRWDREKRIFFNRPESEQSDIINTLLNQSESTKDHDAAIRLLTVHEVLNRLQAITIPVVIKQIIHNYLFELVYGEGNFDPEEEEDIALGREIYEETLKKHRNWASRVQLNTKQRKNIEKYIELLIPIEFEQQSPSKKARLANAVTRNYLRKGQTPQKRTPPRRATPQRKMHTPKKKKPTPSKGD